MYTVYVNLVCVCVCTYMHICALSLSYYPTLDEESSKALGSLRTSEEVTPKDATVNSVRGDCGVCVCALVIILVYLSR